MELKTVGLLCFLLLFVFVSVRSGGSCNNENCRATNGYTCNEHGSCDCGVCTCEAPYKGLTCEECPSCQTPCEVFKGCVGCKIFLTGPVGIMECLTRCDNIATYFPVEKDQFDTKDDDPDLMLCKHTNENLCDESFKIGGMTQGYRDIYVRTEVECLDSDTPTFPPYVPVEVPAYDETLNNQTTLNSIPTTTTIKNMETPSRVTKTTKIYIATSQPIVSTTTTQTTTTTAKTIIKDKRSTEFPATQPMTNSGTKSSVLETTHKMTTDKMPINNANRGDVHVDINSDSPDVVNGNVGSDDAPPEEPGPVAGSDAPRSRNPGSGGIKTSDISILCVLFTALFSVYLVRFV